MTGLKLWYKQQMSYEQAHVTVVPGMQVIALVFYGRRRYASILNVYLERNLASNGGILAEVRLTSRVTCTDGTTVSACSIGAGLIV